ncbi:MAG: DUF2520 domain-containing protein [Gemmatimonadaceae bacterium]
MPNAQETIPSPVAIVGRGRVGSALAAALPRAGVAVEGPLPRGARAAEAPVVLLCVPDGAIAEAAAIVAPGRLVGHCSGATTLDPLAPHEAFSMHPLMSVTGADTRFGGAAAAVEGSTPHALDVATALARTLGMTPVRVAAPDRALYHATGALASNALVTILGEAERLADALGLERAQLAPIARAAVEQWATLGAPRALTGPVARGDELTVTRQRDAIATRAPALLPLWDALVDRTRALAARAREESAS